MDSILTNFRRLTEFAGREPRRRFWPYFAIVVVLYLVISQLVAIPVMGQVMTGMLSAMSDPNTQAALQSGNPLQAEGAMMRAMSGSMFWLQVAGAVEWLAVIGLLAGAIARRLHDSGLTARWGLLPVPLAIIGIALNPFLMSSPTGPLGINIPLFLVMGLLALANLAALVTLIVLLCRGSEPQPNRFGEEVAA